MLPIDLAALERNVSHSETDSLLFPSLAFKLVQDVDFKFLEAIFKFIHSPAPGYVLGNSLINLVLDGLRLTQGVQVSPAQVFSDCRNQPVFLGELLRNLLSLQTNPTIGNCLTTIIHQIGDDMQMQVGLVRMLANRKLSIDDAEPV